MKKSKLEFSLDDMSQSELRRACSELQRTCILQEDELEKLRPKPAKFRQGQLLATLRRKNSAMRDQPATYFVALNVELRDGKYYYGHSSTGLNQFLTIPESELRAITQQEFTGLPGAEAGEAANAPAMEIQAPGLAIPQPVVPAGYPQVWEPLPPMEPLDLHEDPF